MVIPPLRSRATLDLGCDPSDSVKAGPNRLRTGSEPVPVPPLLRVLLRLLSYSFPTPVLLRPCSNPDVLLRSHSDPAPAPAPIPVPASTSTISVSVFQFHLLPAHTRARPDEATFDHWSGDCPIFQNWPAAVPTNSTAQGPKPEAQGLESRRTEQFVYGDPSYHPGFGVMGPYPHTRNRPMNEERLVFNKHMASLRRCVEWGSDQ
jgi:hypothetical protein